jgi:hypothetical protein
VVRTRSAWTRLCQDAYPPTSERGPRQAKGAHRTLRPHQPRLPRSPQAPPHSRRRHRRADLRAATERRSWRLHRRLSIRLTPASLEEWRPVIERNLKRLRSGVNGQPHSRNLDRWELLIGHGDVLALHRVLTGLDRDSIEMREVSPMGGLLPQDERQAALQEAG